MKFNIDRRLLRDKEVDIQHLLNQISTGKAILFTGAGFSKGTKNIKGEEPPLAKNLAIEICRLGMFDEDEDLRFAADCYLSNNDGQKLISLLKEKYTLNDVLDSHINICKVNWRRCYTTNYDQSIEIASGKIGKTIECVDLDFPTDEYYKRESLCIHLNGSINKLTEETFGNSFKLSTSSYISADSFISSPWFYHFKRDLERSSAIVFVGYSMYDIEIQKTLFENESFKEKTYFITVDNLDQKSNFILSKFGNVLPIGVEGFSKLISDNVDLFEYKDHEYNLQALSLYEVSDDTQQIRDSNVETMLMYGDINKTFIDGAVVGQQRLPYLVLRNKLDLILGFLQKKQNSIIFSELGNGKSIFLRELKPYLSVNSIEVYEVSDWEGDYIGDIDALSQSSRNVVIILDSYERYLDLITHYCHSKPNNINIVASARTSEHERLRPELKKMGFFFQEINIDFLNDDEASKFVDIIDNVGMWGARAGLSHERKIACLKFENNLQISLALLNLFQAPQIKDRVSSVLANVISDKNHKDTIFSISLIELLDLSVNFSLVSDVSGNDDIYSSNLRHNESFKELFKLDNNQVISKSSLFCLSLIRNHFSATYIASQLQRIAQRFNEYKRKNFEQERIFKSMLRFSFVESLLPEANKKNNLKNYYEDLKISVPWLKNDPHFWLQYGMAYTTFKEYTKAQSFLDQAYSLAAKKDNYHTSNIDTQQARLFILMAINESDSSKVFNYFENAHKLLSRLDNDVYKFRQVEKYRDYFDACYSRLSKGHKVDFEHFCKRMSIDIEYAEINGEIDAVQQKTIRKAKDNLLYILNAMSPSKVI